MENLKIGPVYSKGGHLVSILLILVFRALGILFSVNKLKGLWIQKNVTQFLRPLFIVIICLFLVSASANCIDTVVQYHTLDITFNEVTTYATNNIPLNSTVTMYGVGNSEFLHSLYYFLVQELDRSDLVIYLAVNLGDLRTGSFFFFVNGIMPHTTDSVIMRTTQR